MLPSLSLSSSPTSMSTTIKVDKATSELLVSTDWTINLDICDLCNSNPSMAKDVIKGVKRRLQHKNPKVQLLTLTLLETMVKNCGDYIHYQISERKLLDDMVKIVKKKGDFLVRDKILSLLDSWQEAFGGSDGKYPQYYRACDELRRCGVQFPQRSQRTAPVITPPLTQPPRISQVGFGMPSNSSRRLEEALTSDVEGLSVSTLEAMQNVLELLNDMLQAVNPNDCMAVKDEVIVDLADHCRANQKKLMQMIVTTTDENLLAQGLEMNDSLQNVLAKHDAIASGAPLPINGSHLSIQKNVEASKVIDKSPAANGKPPVSAGTTAKDQIEEEEEEDEFALLVRRHSKSYSVPSQSCTSGATEDEASSSVGNNALVFVDTHTPETTTSANNSKEQDLIDLLSIVLTTSSPSEVPEGPNPTPAQCTFESTFNSYVVPWAQPQPQQTVQPLSQFQNQYQSMQPQNQQGYSQYVSAYPPPPWEATSGYSNPNFATNPYMYGTSKGIMNNSPVPMQGARSSQNVNTNQYPQYGNQPTYSTAQLAANPPPMHENQPLQHSNSFQNPSSVNGNLFSDAKAADSPSLSLVQGVQSLQHTNSFPARATNGLALNGSTHITNGSALNGSTQFTNASALSGSRQVANGNGSALIGSTLFMNGSSGIPSGQKPYIPSYRLFEDLNVLGSSEAKLKNGPYSSASGNPSQNMIAGRRW